MWWLELDAMAGRLDRLPAGIDIAADAEVDRSATLDCSRGPIRVGAGSRICAGAHISGPVDIGERCVIGNQALVRGPASIGDGVRIGFASEVKNAILEAGASVGPQCFVADSKLGRDAYLGAQVRTSNHRLDGRTVTVMVDGRPVDSGRDKLGCLIGDKAALGIQVIVLPGRTVAPGAIFAPRITIDKNLPPGRYRLKQDIEAF